MYKKLSLMTACIVLSNISALTMESHQSKEIFESNQNVAGLSKENKIENQRAARLFAENFIKGDLKETFENFKYTIIFLENNKNFPWYGYIQKSYIEKLSNTILSFYDEKKTLTEKKEIIKQIWGFFFSFALSSLKKAEYESSLFYRTIRFFLSNVGFVLEDKETKLNQGNFSYAPYEDIPLLISEGKTLNANMKKYFNSFLPLLNILHEYFFDEKDSGIPGYIDSFLLDEERNTELHFHNAVHCMSIGVIFYNHFSKMFFKDTQEELFFFIREKILNAEKKSLMLQELNTKYTQKISEMKKDIEKQEEQHKKTEIFILSLQNKKNQNQALKKTEEKNKILKSQLNEQKEKEKEKEKSMKELQEENIFLKKELEVMKNKILQSTQKNLNEIRLKEEMQKLHEQQKQLKLKNKSLSAKLNQTQKHLTETKMVVNHKKLTETSLKELQQQLEQQKQEYELLLQTTQKTTPQKEVLDSNDLQKKIETLKEELEHSQKNHEILKRAHQHALKENRELKKNFDIISQDLQKAFIDIQDISYHKDYLEYEIYIRDHFIRQQNNALIWYQNQLNSFEPQYAEPHQQIKDEAPNENQNEKQN